MTCYTAEQLADRLDDLLEGDERTLVDRHVESCSVCAGLLEQVRARQSLIASPYFVTPPPIDLRERARHEHAVRSFRGGRLLRYAASFAAGVVVTLAFNAMTRATPTSTAESPSRPAAPQPITSERLPTVPRRIH